MKLRSIKKRWTNAWKLLRKSNSSNKGSSIFFAVAFAPGLVLLASPAAAVRIDVLPSCRINSFQNQDKLKLICLRNTQRPFQNVATGLFYYNVLWATFFSGDVAEKQVSSKNVATGFFLLRFFVGNIFFQEALLKNRKYHERGIFVNAMLLTFTLLKVKHQKNNYTVRLFYSHHLAGHLLRHLV